MVAIGPVRVESEQAHDGLAEKLAQTLEQGLTRGGAVELVSRDDVALAVEAFKADEVGEPELRGIAAGLGADWVLRSRVSEIAGQFSLELLLIPQDNGRYESEKLLVTASGVDALVQRTAEVVPSLLDIVAPPAAMTVLDLRFEGAYTPDADVIAALETKPGGALDRSKVQADIERLRALPEVAAAAVQLDRSEEGVIVRFQLVAQDLVEEVEAEMASKNELVEIHVEGNRRIEADAIRARMASKIGQAFSAARVSRDIRSIYQLGFFGDVKIFRELGEAGWVLSVVVEENPVVREVAITGNDKVDSEEIKDALTLTTGSVLDFSLLYENTARIEGLYRANGFYLAEVSYEIEDVTEDSVAVNFEVIEGKKLRLRKIRFEGNEKYSDRKLRKNMKTKTWKFWSWATAWFTKEGTYSEPLFAQDLRSVSERYSDNGYLRVEVGSPEVKVTGKGIEIVVQVEEGDRYRVGMIDVVGDATVDLGGLRKDLELEEGEIFNRSHLTEDVEGLTSHYTDRGFYFASVSPRTNLRQEELVVDVSYEVEKGPLYFIREIKFSGNTTTVDPVLRSEMHMVEGELYSARAIEISRRRLRGLGFFEDVQFEPVPADEAGELDLDVKVVERATGSFSLGAGFSSQDGIIFTGSLSQSNLFGRGYAVRLSADVGGTSNRFYLSFTDPRLRDTEFSLTSTIYRSEVQFESFEESREGLSFIFGHPLNEDRTARGFLGYSFSRQQIDQGSTNINASASILRERLNESSSTSQLSLSVTGNSLDDYTSPTEGLTFGSSLEYAGLGGFTKYARVEGRVRYFIPGPDWLPKRSTFMIGGGIGYTEPFNEISDWTNPFEITDTDWAIYDGLVDAGLVNGDNLKALDEIDTDLTLPLSERYFLGGLGRYQLRGYKARSLGPRRSILNTVDGKFFTTIDRDLNGICRGANDEILDDDQCNQLSDRKDEDFANLNLTDVIGGSKFMNLTGEYRFSISEAMGLVGILFVDAGNSFSEEENLFDASLWRYGTGFGVQWFSPFGPLQAFYGIPLNPNEVEDSSVFEFSMGGQNY